jgi:hypothetical protein
MCAQGDYETTIGVEFGTRLVTLDEPNAMVKLQIWDTVRGRMPRAHALRVVRGGC